GAHNNARPISSSTTPSSTNENPAPPSSSGTASPWRPSCSPICTHTAGSYPSTVSMSRRTSVSGDLSSRKARTVRRSSSCSSLNPKSWAGPLLLVEKVHGKRAARRGLHADRRRVSLPTTELRAHRRDEPLHRLGERARQRGWDLAVEVLRAGPFLREQLFALL